MAFLYQHNNVTLTDTTVRVSVPENPVGKLMYYLNCVCVTLELRNIDGLARLRDFKNYHILTHFEKQELIKLCRELHPSVFDDKVFFHNDSLCGDMTNKFYNVRSVSQTLAVTSAVFVAGEMRAVKKIMTYKMEWLDDNYYRPMQALLNPSSYVTYVPVRRSSWSGKKCFCKGMKIAALVLLCPLVCPIFCLCKLCSDK